MRDTTLIIHTAEKIKHTDLIVINIINTIYDNIHI